MFYISSEQYALYNYKVCLHFRISFLMDGIQFIGETTYRRVIYNVTAGDKTIQKRMWIPDGFTEADKHVVWMEEMSINKSTIYALLSNPSYKINELPDIVERMRLHNQTPSTLLSNLGVMAFQPCAQWKNVENFELLKSKILDILLMNMNKDVKLSYNAFQTIFSNIVNEFMSKFINIMKEEILWVENRFFVSIKNISPEETNLYPIPPLHQLPRNIESVNSTLHKYLKPSMKTPLNNLISGMNFLSDPYYHSKLLLKSTKGDLEAEIERSLSLKYNEIIKVLTSLPVKLKEFRYVPRHYLSIIRDIHGIYLLAITTLPDSVNTLNVHALYPVLNYFELICEETNCVVCIDNAEIGFKVESKAHAEYFEEMVKVGLCEMYSTGKDIHHITKARHYAFELSILLSEPPLQSDDIQLLLAKILNEDVLHGKQIKHMFSSLSTYYKFRAGRVEVLQGWLNYTESRKLNQYSSIPLWRNYMQVIMDFIRTSTNLHNSVLLCQIEDKLNLLCECSPVEIYNEVVVTRNLWKLVIPILNSILPRENDTCIPYPLCFNIMDTDNSLTPKEKLKLEWKYTTGIYLTVICICDNEIFVNYNYSMFSVQIVPTVYSKLLSINICSEYFKWILYDYSKSFEMNTNEIPLVSLKNLFITAKRRICDNLSISNIDFCI